MGGEPFYMKETTRLLKRIDELGLAKNIIFQTPTNCSDFPSKEITDIIYWFKLMSLPMSSNENPRISILPAEWEINFKGPILGHIEHPQNCFLSTVDVDYSGGKDMSFIESASANARTENDACTPDTELGDIAKDHRVQHYPNGITLTLTFKEILNIDRLRYVGRVAASARGANQDTQREIKDFELGQGNNSLGPGQTGANATEEGDIVAGSRKPTGSHNQDFGRRGGSGSHND